MTTYYGVWWEKPRWWWQDGSKIFHTPLLNVAKATAMAANQANERKYKGQKVCGIPHWEARAIGEDGLPAKEWQRPHTIVCKPCHLERCRAVLDATEERHQIRLEAANHLCDWCGDVAMGWTQMAVRRWYHCDRCEAWAREASHTQVLHKRRGP